MMIFRGRRKRPGACWAWAEQQQTGYLPNDGSIPRIVADERCFSERVAGVEVSNRFQVL